VKQFSASACMFCYPEDRHFWKLSTLLINQNIFLRFIVKIHMQLHN